LDTGPGHAATITLPAFLIEGSDQEFRRFIYDFLITSIRLERIRDRIGALIGLSGMQFHILMVVSEVGASRAVTVSDVAEVLGANAAHITMETRKLEQRGLIAKERNPADGRSVLLSVTDAGIATIETLAPHQRRINDALFDGLDRRQFEAFRTLIARMVDNTSSALWTADRISDERARAGNKKLQKEDA
jgi:DNA-binding MarR family transcriptional regulator